MQLTFNTFGKLIEATIGNQISKYLQYSYPENYQLDYSVVKDYCYNYLCPERETDNMSIHTYFDGEAKVYKLSDNVFWSIVDTENEDFNEYFDNIYEAHKYALLKLFEATFYDKDKGIEVEEDDTLIDNMN